MIKKNILSVFKILDFLVPEVIRESIQGIHYNTTHKQLKKQTWKKFHAETKGKQIILIGTDTGYSDYLQKYGTNYVVFGVYDHFMGRVGQIKNGYRIKNIQDLELQNCSQYTILITTTLYNEHIADLLEKMGIKNYYSYIQMEIKRPLYQIFKPLYFLRYRIVPYWRTYISNYFILEIKSVLRSCHLGCGYHKYKHLKKIKNTHIGERCFIVATGPSLSIEDVELLKNEITFGVNGITRMYSSTDWRPTYYAICDFNVYADSLSLNPDYTAERNGLNNSFITDKIEKLYHRDMKLSQTIVVPYNYLNHMISARNLRFKYNKNLVHGGYNCCTVVNFSINIAHYMGFKEIYLIGVDCTNSDDKQYFDDYVQKQKQNPYMKTMCERNSIFAYEFIHKKLKKDRVQIYNATRGGALEVFPRVDLDTVIEKGEL